MLLQMLLEETGTRYMSTQEQVMSCPTELRCLYPLQERPVWLFLGIVLRDLGYLFQNGLGVNTHMQNMREAYENSRRSNNR